MTRVPMLGSLLLVCLSCLHSISGSSQVSHHLHINHNSIESSSSHFNLKLLTTPPSTDPPSSSSAPSVSILLTTSSDQSNSKSVSIGGYPIPLDWFIPIVVIICLSCLFVTFYFPLMSFLRESCASSAPRGEIDPREPPQPALAMVV